MIDYLYLHNGYVTQSGYTIIVKNGIIKHIQDNTILGFAQLSQKGSTRQQMHASMISPETLTAAIAKANEEVNAISSGCVIKEQREELFYDIHDDRYYCRIFTAYETPDGVCGAIVTMYEL